jgi:hypothetical protein
LLGFHLPWYFLQPVWIPPKLQMRTVCTDIALLLSRSWGFIFILTTTRMMKYCSDFQKVNALLACHPRYFNIWQISLKECWSYILTRSSSFDTLLLSLSFHSESIFISVLSLNSKTSFFCAKLVNGIQEEAASWQLPSFWSPHVTTLSSCSWLSPEIYISWIYVNRF